MFTSWSPWQQPQMLPKAPPWPWHKKMKSFEYAPSSKPSASHMTHQYLRKLLSGIAQFNEFVDRSSKQNMFALCLMKVPKSMHIRKYFQLVLPATALSTHLLQFSKDQSLVATQILQVHNFLPHH